MTLTIFSLTVETWSLFSLFIQLLRYQYYRLSEVRSGNIVLSINVGGNPYSSHNFTFNFSLPHYKHSIRIQAPRDESQVDYDLL
jgi:hypothetical protein